MPSQSFIFGFQFVAMVPYIMLVIHNYWRWRQAQGSCSNVTLAYCVTAFILHAIAINLLIQHPFGWNIQFESSLSLIIAFATLIICITLFKTPIHAIAICHAILAVAVIAYSTVTIHRPPEFVAYELGWHVALSIAAFSSYGIASIHSILIWLYQRQLKSHQQMRLPLLNQLPSLENMNQLLINFIIACFILLTLSIVSGYIFLTDIMEQQLSHKLFFTVMTWLVCSIIIIKHYLSGWNSMNLMKWIWAGFVFLMLAYLGSKFVIERLL